MSQQKEARQNLSSKIFERQVGLIESQNPILANKYEHKLKNLTTFMDLVQEGKMTYTSHKGDAFK